jgi:uncharacterized protein YjbI with pentapeptide repeats
MTEESNNNQNNQPTEEQQPPDETQPKYREISEEELKQILEDHKKWLESDGKEGNQANFENANLEGKSGHRANFEKVNLKGVRFRNSNINHGMLNETILDSAVFYKASLKQADFRKAKLNNSDFRKADLTIARFQKAQLKEANFEKAILINTHLEETECQDANFRKAKFANAHFSDAKINRANLQKADLSYVDGLNEAELQYADLRGATGLLGNEFAQTDLTGTKLPDDIKEFKTLEVVEKTSQNAKKIFFAMLSGCVYSWLAIATTTDVRLLTNTASSPLPIIQTEIPIAGFYLAAPLVLICIFFYFHFYLNNLWKNLANLPAIFPDGKPLDLTVYPWLLNSLVCRHFRLLIKREELEKPRIFKRKVFTILKKLGVKKEIHKRPLIIVVKEWIIIFLAWWVVPITLVYFWLRYIPRHDWWGTSFHIGLIVLSVAFGIKFYRLCSLILQGKEIIVFQLQNFWKDKRFYYGVSVALVAVLFSLLSYGAINGNKLIDNVTGEKRKINFYKFEDLIPWVFKKVGYDIFANFRENEVSIKPSDYYKIEDVKKQIDSIKGANLKGRNLNNADMYGAFLVKADLREASLKGANLKETNLQKANLSYANLEQTWWKWTNLQEANFWGANLQQANFPFVNLQEAGFSHANLQGASFEDANLKKVNFGNANLEGACIAGAKLQEADFYGANLKKADLYLADLTGAKNLKIEQLSKVKTLYQAKLDPELMEQVRQCCPHLLEKPKEEPDKKE